MVAAGHGERSNDDLVLPPDPAGFSFDLERDLLCTADVGAGRFTSLNDTWERVLGWSREELTSRPYKDFVHPDDVPATNAATALLAQPGEQLTRFENRYRTSEGAWRWLRWSVRSDGETLIGIAIDVTDEHRAESRIRAAIAEGRLVVHAQPVVELAGRRRVGSELLVRLRDAENAELLLPPSEFLPEAEADGSVTMIDRWVTRLAIELARRGESPSVNLSGETLDDGDTVEELAGHLEEAGEAAARLTFELGERTLAESRDAATEFVRRMSELGVRFAIDGFGTGLASAVGLREIGFETVKIARSAIAAIEADAEQRALVRGVAAMCGELGLRTVAVGIERPRTLALCMEFGIDLGQGYLLDRPAPVEL